MNRLAIIVCMICMIGCGSDVVKWNTWGDLKYCVTADQYGLLNIVIRDNNQEYTINTRASVYHKFSVRVLSASSLLVKSSDIGDQIIERLEQGDFAMRHTSDFRSEKASSGCPLRKSLSHITRPQYAASDTDDCAKGQKCLSAEIPEWRFFKDKRLSGHDCRLAEYSAYSGTAHYILCLDFTYRTNEIPVVDSVFISSNKIYRVRQGDNGCSIAEEKVDESFMKMSSELRSRLNDYEYRRTFWGCDIGFVVVYFLDANGKELCRAFDRPVWSRAHDNKVITNNSFHNDEFVFTLADFIYMYRMVDEIESLL